MIATMPTRTRGVGRRPVRGRHHLYDGRVGYAELTLDVPEREMGKPAFAVLSDAVSGIEVPGLRVELGGDAVFLNAAEENSAHMGIGLLVALLVLLVVFGTLVAAIVPIGLSIIAVGAGIGAIALLAGAMDVSESAIPVAALVGLGVGVDYALFVVSRYRENRSPATTTTKPSPARWAPRDRRSSSPAAPSPSPRQRSRSPGSAS